MRFSQLFCLRIAVTWMGCIYLTEEKATRNCDCHLANTEQCTVQDGKITCICHEGFTGTHCDEDIDECQSKETNKTCAGEPNTYCRNLYGSSVCECVMGFNRSASGLCLPCGWMHYGSNCDERCVCNGTHTQFCESTYGNCICKLGWEGEQCDRSVDDCLRADCGVMKCVDGHRSYSCYCGKDQIYSRRSCHDVKVDLYTPNLNPVHGQIVSIYFFWEMSAFYQIAPELHVDIVYELFYNEDAFCIISFQKSYVHLKGDEDILKELNTNKKYHYYSRYFIRLDGGTPIVTLTAKPKAHELETQRVVFNIKDPGNQVEECLSKMKIDGTTPCARYDISCSRSGVNPRQVKRQDYLQFKVEQNPTNQCVVKPKYKWTYFHTTVDTNVPFRELLQCPSSQGSSFLDIPDLISEAKNPHISDQQSVLDILPGSTLPVGLVLVCVKGSVDKNVAHSLVTCGVLEVTVSFALTGSLHPLGSFLYIKCGYYKDRTRYYEIEQNVLAANIYDPDHAGYDLVYNWTIRKVHKNKEEDWKIMPGRKEKHKIFFTNADLETVNSPNSWFYHLKVYVFYKAFPDIVTTRELKFYYFLEREGHKYTPMFPFKWICVKNCYGGRVGIDRSFELRVNDSITEGWDLKVWKTTRRRKWVIMEGGKAINQTRREQILGWKHENFIRFYLKPNVLKPGVDYILQFSASYLVKAGINKKYRHRTANITFRAFAEFKFSTEPPPTGNGCSIKPSAGKAVFTKFTVTCLDYEDTVSKLPLLFHLFQKSSVEEHSMDYSLIAYGGDPVMTNITLSSPEVDCNITVGMKVKIVNVRGTSTSVFFTVDLEVEDQEVIVDKLVKATWLQNAGSIGQEGVRSVNDAATVITKEATADKEEKSLLRNQLLSTTEDFDIQSDESIEHTSLALEKSSFVEDEISSVGLIPGLSASEKLTKHVGKVSNDDVDNIVHIARMLTSSVGRLMSVATENGRSILRNNQKLLNKFHSLLKNKEETDKGVRSIEQIAEVLLRNVDKINRYLTVKTDRIDVGVTEHTNKENTLFTFGKPDTASFDMPVSDAGGPRDGTVRGSYQVFEKNPFVYAVKDIFGDLPLMKVEFVRSGTDDEMENGNETTRGGKQYKKKLRFSNPAHVFLHFNASDSETAYYPAVIDVHKRLNETVVHKSSCIFMAVPVSTTANTVLEIWSPDDLPLVVKMAYSNKISSFEQILDTEAMDVPQLILQTTQSSDGMKLNRTQNFVFLPQLTQTRKKKGIDSFRVSISIKLSAEVDTMLLNKSEHQGWIQGTDSHLEGIEAYNTTIALTPYKMACMNLGPEAKAFLSDDCMLTQYTSKSLMHCRCIAAAAFTGNFLVLPKLINPLDFDLFLDFFRNPLAITLVLATWMLYFAAMIWGRLKDDADYEECLATVLEDNADNHTYVYLICVSTGWSPRAATTSRVYMYIKGSWATSETHLLHDPSKLLFKSGAQNWFILTTADDLGEIESVVVWTDFSGGHPSWYLNSVFVENLQTKEAWICLYSGWLSSYFGSLRLLAEIPATKDEQISNQWMTNWANKTKVDMRNDHMWIGMFAKTAYNRFTRVRRLTTALTMLQALMLLNLMFFGLLDPDDPGQFVTILGQTIHLTSLIITIQSTAIITALGYILATLFNRIKPKPVPDKNEIISEEQLDLLKRQESMKKRKEYGLWLLFPSYAEKDPRKFGSAVDALATSTSKGSSTISSHSSRGQKGQVIKSVESDSESESQKSESKSTKSSKSGGEAVVSRKASKLSRGTRVSFWKSTKENSDQMIEEMILEHDKQVSKVDNSFKLPWWTIYITWSVLVVFNPLMSYYIMLYGLSLGYEKSLEWLLAFFSGFLLNALILSPFKVFLMTTMLVLVFKHKYTLKEQSPLTRMAEGLKLLENKYTRDLATKQTKRGIPPQPLSRAETRQVLERLKVESEGREALRDFILYTIFMVMMLFVITGHVDVSDSYLQKINVETEFLGIKHPEDHSGHNFISNIKTVPDVWNYIIDVLTPRVVIGDIVPNDVRKDYVFVTNVRLRQIRSVPVTSDECPPEIPRILMIQNCSKSSSNDFVEEKRNYDGDWSAQTVESGEYIRDSIYRYWNEQDLETAAFHGEHGSYSGGGYVVILYRSDPEAVRNMLIEIERKKWIDLLTRCIFVEFTVLNPSLDLFTQVRLVFEWTDTGSIFSSQYINTGKLSDSTREQRFWLQVAEGISALCLVFYLYTCILQLLQSWFKKFFRQFWNWIEVSVILLSMMCGICYLMRKIKFVDVTYLFGLHGHGFFVDFTQVFYWHDVLQYTAGFLAALLIIKMFKVISMNPLFKVFTKTLTIGRKDLMGYIYITMIMIISFAALGHLLFGSHTSAYSTMRQTLLSLLFFLIGQPAYQIVNQILGQLFFVSFLMISQYIILNFFFAILRESLEIAQFMPLGHERAVIRYMKGIMALYFTTSDNKQSNRNRPF